MIKLRNIIYNLLSFVDAFFGREEPLVIVLCYHNIGNDNWKFSIAKSEFKKQINYLIANREPISLSTLYSYISGETLIEKPSFIVTFDDGCKGVLEVVGFLKSKNINPTMFLIANSKEANRRELDNNIKLLNKKDALTLIKMGWEIGCHSMTHADFNNLGSTINEEIVNSKRKLKLNLNLDVNYFSFPKGRYNNEIVETLQKAKYKLAVTMDDSIINRYTDLYAIPRIGIDQTHSFKEFKSTISPSTIQLRGLIKKTFLFKYI